MFDPNGFYEDDEPVEDIARLFDAGPHWLTGVPVPHTYAEPCRVRLLTPPPAWTRPPTIWPA